MTKSPADLLPDDYVRAIGRLVVTVSHIDILLTDLIGIFLQAHPINSLIAVHHQQPLSKIDTLLALSRLAYDDDPAFSQVSTLLSDAKSIVEFRNTIVHSYWTIDDDGTILSVRFSARRRLTRRRNPYTSKQIHERADEASALAERLGSFRDLLGQRHSQMDALPDPQ